MQPVSDAKYFRHLAREIAVRDGVAYEVAVYSLQLELGISWNNRDVSTIMGTTKKESEEIYHSALRKLIAHCSGFGINKNGQMVMFDHDPVDI